MSDARGTIPGYPLAAMSVLLLKDRGIARGIDSDGVAVGDGVPPTSNVATNVTAYSARKAERFARMAALVQKHQIPPAPPYYYVGLNIVDQAAERVRHKARIILASSACAAIIVSLLLLVLSGNGLTVAIAAFATGVSSGLMMTRIVWHREGRLETERVAVDGALIAAASEQTSAPLAS